MIKQVQKLSDNMDAKGDVNFYGVHVTNTKHGCVVVHHLMPNQSSNVCVPAIMQEMCAYVKLCEQTDKCPPSPR